MGEAKKLKPVHPREILREEFMKPFDLSTNRLALDLRVPVTRIADIGNERRGITADTALRLARYFKNTIFLDEPANSLQLGSSGDELAAKVGRDVHPLETAFQWMPFAPQMPSRSMPPLAYTHRSPRLRRLPTSEAATTPKRMPLPKIPYSLWRKSYRQNEDSTLRLA